jgi:hypothetical protein
MGENYLTEGAFSRKYLFCFNQSKAEALIIILIISKMIFKIICNYKLPIFS